MSTSRLLGHISVVWSILVHSAFSYVTYVYPTFSIVLCRQPFKKYVKCGVRHLDQGLVGPSVVLHEIPDTTRKPVIFTINSTWLTAVRCFLNLYKDQRLSDLEKCPWKFKITFCAQNRQPTLSSVFSRSLKNPKSIYMEKIERSSKKFRSK